VTRFCQVEERWRYVLVLTVNREISAAEKFNQKKHLPEIEDKLIPYNLSKLGGQETQRVDHVKGVEEWQKLTCCIKGALLTKLTRHQWNHWEVSSTHDYKAVSPQGLLPGRDEVLAFIFPKDERTFTSTSRGRDRTEQAMVSMANSLGSLPSILEVPPQCFLSNAL